VRGGNVPERWKDIIIIIILGTVSILAGCWFIDVLLIDGLEVDKGFLGSVLGGIIGALGVVGTTYFLIEANKQETKDAADLQDDKEKKRFFVQLTISKSEDTLLKLGELNDRLIEYKRFTSLALMDLRTYKLFLYNENRVFNNNNNAEQTDEVKLEELKNNVYKRFVESSKSIAETQMKINNLFLIIKSRDYVYSNAQLGDINRLFGKLSDKVNGFINNGLNSDEEYFKIVKAMNNYEIDNDINLINIKIDATIDSIFSIIEGEINKLK